MANYTYNARTNAFAKPSAKEGGDESWKSDAALNAWLHLPNGRKFKMGTFFYKRSKKQEAKLLEILQMEGVMENLKDYVEFDFQIMDDEDDGENMFAFLAKPKAVQAKDRNDF